MSIGYNPDDFVWSTDLTTGRAYTADVVGTSPTSGT